MNQSVPKTELLQEGPLTCLTLLVLILILVFILAVLMLYQRHVARKTPVQHLCDYCGHMVRAVSDCHHAPVRERFLHGICLECKRECRLVCENCKRPV